MSPDTRPTVHVGDFHITNICNYSCEGCCRMSDHRFSGHQRWDDYAAEYEELSKKITFGRMSFTGGEPFLNPDIINWIVGIRKLWPEVEEFAIGTNGSRLKYIKNLYQTILENNVILNICAHTKETHDEHVAFLKSFLQGPITFQYKHDVANWAKEYNLFRKDGWPECTSIEEFDQLPVAIKEECTTYKYDPHTFLSARNSYLWTDSNGVRVMYNHSIDFTTGPLKYIGNNQFDIYDSVPEKAHKVCFSKKCHVLYKGKFYKCAHVALLPEFIEQYHVNISDEDKAMLLEYKPLDKTASREEILDYFQMIEKPIPQCKLCPSEISTIKINGHLPKQKIIKLKKLS